MAGLTAGSRLIRRATLLSAEKSGPEGAVMSGDEIGFLHRRRWNQRLEIADEGVEGGPCGHAGTIRRAELGEIGPVVLHVAGELELLSVERRVRNRDREVEKVLQFGTMSCGVGEGDRREEILWRFSAIVRPL